MFFLGGGGCFFSVIPTFSTHLTVPQKGTSTEQKPPGAHQNPQIPHLQLLRASRLRDSQGDYIPPPGNLTNGYPK